MSSALYWLSASVLTITVAPTCKQASSPLMNARARPWFRVANDVVDAVFRYARGFVGASVVDDEPLTELKPEPLGSAASARASVSASLARNLNQQFQEQVPRQSLFISRRPRRGPRTASSCIRVLRVALISRHEAPSEAADFPKNPPVDSSAVRRALDTLSRAGAPRATEDLSMCLRMCGAVLPRRSPTPILDGNRHGTEHDSRARGRVDELRGAAVEVAAALR
jgi:hypothetical protein